MSVEVKDASSSGEQLEPSDSGSSSAECTLAGLARRNGEGVAPKALTDLLWRRKRTKALNFGHVESSDQTKGQVAKTPKLGASARKAGRSV